jgi:tetratricopeptide (TPR) repeat protein
VESALALRPGQELLPEPPALRLIDLDAPPVEPAYGSADRLVRSAETHNREGDFSAALEVMARAWPLLDQGARTDVVLRALYADSWARMYAGELERSLELLDRARALVEAPTFGDVDRAEVLYRIGCCRTKLSQVANAVQLFTLALTLCDRTHLPCDRLRVEILEWRSRCYQRQRDLDAARSDVERALELAGRLGDRHSAAHVYFQASLIAERTKQWLLARYAEEARAIYEQVGDRANLARMLNNLGGLSQNSSQTGDGGRLLRRLRRPDVPRHDDRRADEQRQQELHGQRVPVPPRHSVGARLPLAVRGPALVPHQAIHAGVWRQHHLKGH